MAAQNQAQNPFVLRQAKRGAIYARACLFGKAGQGKTYTALAIGIHLCKRLRLDPATALAVIDTEETDSPDQEKQGSAEKYENRPCNCSRCHREGPRFAFRTMVLPSTHRSPDDYQRAMKVCREAGVVVLVIDGLTEAWRSLLRLVSEVEARDRKADGWSVARPVHKQFVEALLHYPGHLICCMRAKPESRHKDSEFQSAAALPDQDPGILHEFDVACFVDGGTSYVVKTRYDPIEGHSFPRGGDDMAEHLLAWCADPHNPGGKPLNEIVAELRVKIEAALTTATPEVQRQAKDKEILTKPLSRGQLERALVWVQENQAKAPTKPADPEPDYAPDGEAEDQPEQPPLGDSAGEPAHWTDSPPDEGEHWLDPEAEEFSEFEDPA